MRVNWKLQDRSCYWLRPNYAVAKARAEDTLIGALGPRMIRLVTHLDVSADGAKRAGKVLLRANER